MKNGKRSHSVEVVRRPPEPAFCTIFSRAEAAPARALLRSLRRHRPGCRIYACPTDAGAPHLGETTLDESWVHPKTFASKHLTAFRRRYTASDLPQVLLPLLLAHVLERERAVVYFDPSIIVFGPMRDLRKQLAEASILMVPYATRPRRPGEEHLDEIGLIATGAYNDGFLGLRSDEAARAFLSWWAARAQQRSARPAETRRSPVRARSWWDLAPCYFETLRVLRDPRYGATALDVTRDLSLKSGHLYAGKVRSHFFQFTPDVEPPPSLRALYRAYRAELRVAERS